MTKLMLLNVLKIGVLGSLGAMLAGIPGDWSVLLNVFFLGWGVHAFGSSYVGGMVEPDENSSRAYVHFFRTMHLMFHRSTAYFTHKSMWKLFTKIGE